MINDKLTEIIHKIKMEETKEVSNTALEKVAKDILFYHHDVNDSMEVYWLKIIINKSNLTRSRLKTTFINKQYKTNFNNLLNSLNNSMIESNTLNIWCDILSLERTLPFKVPEDIKSSIKKN